MDELAFRRFGGGDSVDDLTALLHRAYAEHAAAGRRFFAAYQTPEDTRKRIAKGECWLVEHRGAVVGTVTVTGRHVPPSRFPAAGPFGTFSQLAVLPEVRAKGFGSRLVSFAERRLGELGASDAVIDTSALATDLIAWYERRGYARVGSWKWDVTNYESVVLRKSLARELRGR
jgi:GNAT superfamily N-acetyltransferase